jgi:hypothetical protein
VTEKKDAPTEEGKEGEEKKKKKKKKSKTGDAPKKTTHFNMDAKRDILEAQAGLKKKQQKMG